LNFETSRGFGKSRRKSGSWRSGKRRRREGIAVSSTLSQELSLGQRLKISTFARGLRVDTAAEDQLTEGGRVPLSLHEYATTGGVTFALPGDIYINAPFDDWFCSDPDATLTYDAGAARFSVRYEDEEIPVRMLRLPGYLGLRDHRGNPITDVVMSHCDRARLSPIVGCAFDCKFCDLAGMRYVRRPAEQLIEALNVALGDTTLPVRHVLISGGTPGPKDFDYYDEACEAVIQSTHLQVDVMMVPRTNPDWIDRVMDAGLYGFAINTEVYGDEPAQDIIRLKHRLGLSILGQNIGRAVERTGGNGRVRSLILVGLEPLESTLEGVEFIARLGCDPCLSPFRPARGTKLAQLPPPNEKFMERVFLRALDIADRYGVKLGPRCIPCQHNTLTFPDGTPAYYFS
jgi:hypothetical protein